MAVRVSLPLRVQHRLRRALLSRDFALLWGGQTISAMGSQLSSTALIVLAILSLRATPAQASLLTILGTVPFLLVGPWAGALADIFPRRLVMIAADAGRALTLGAIPLAALAGVLNFNLLAGVLLLAGMLAVFFEVAYPAFTPSLVAPERLLAANGKLAASEALAEVGGPALAGTLVQALGGPVVMLLDALSFVVSAASLCLMRVRAPVTQAARIPAADRVIWQEVRAGWRVALGAPVARLLLLCETLGGLAGGFFAPLYAVYVLRELHVAATLYGALIALGGVSALVGTATVAVWARRLGPRRTLILAWVGIVAGQALIPLATGAPWLVIALLALAQLGDIAWVMYHVTATTLTQEYIAAPYLGRVTACFRFAGALALLVGAALTALLSTFIPVRALLGMGVAMSALALGCLIRWAPQPVKSQLSAPEIMEP